MWAIYPFMVCLSLRQIKWVGISGKKKTWGRHIVGDPFMDTSLGKLAE